jgi:hypothetical protein
MKPEVANGKTTVPGEFEIKAVRLIKDRGVGVMQAYREPSAVLELRKAVT